MDPRLLDYYNRELGYLRELGAEFAQQHPKIAGRLGMSGIEVADPYVERLLEGFAFLAGRIHLKMDAEFPRFSQRLLELVYPHYLRPTPAMGIARLTPSLMRDGVTSAFHIPRHTLLRAPATPGQVTACEFRTAHEVTLLPLDIVDASVEGVAAPLPMSNIPAHKSVRSSLRLRFAARNGLEMQAIGVERISLYIGGPTDRASHLLELIGGRLLGGILSWQADGSDHQRWLPPASITCDGYAENEALLPYDSRSFSGYRLLHEYFACPDRFRFFSIRGIGDAAALMLTDQFTVTLLFDQAATLLEKTVSKDDFELNCTPIINLFPKRGDLVDVSMANYEHHMVVDRTRPLDYEVHTILRLHGYTDSNTEQQVFLPLLETFDHQSGDHQEGFFSIRREPRLLSDTAKRSGSRSGYIGSEVFVQLVDQQDAPYSHQLKRIAPDILCTNRDLPLLVSSGFQDLELAVSAPVSEITILGGLTPPVPAMAERDITWRLISHLHLNYQTLTDLSPADGAQAMRDLLGLYSVLGRRGIEGQAQSVRSMRVTPMVCRVPQPGPIAFGRGVSIETTVDTTAFAGHSPWLLGAVLEQFMARHVSINSAIQFHLSTLQQGAFAEWPVRQGARPIA